jgi:hypothetical protein
MKSKTIFVTALVCIFLLQIGTVLAEEEYVRRLVTKNSELGITEVRLGITFPGDVILIDEDFSPENCSVVDYTIDQEMYINIFENNSNSWLFGNTTKGVNIILEYIIPYDCDVTGGKHYVSEEEPEEDPEAGTNGDDNSGSTGSSNTGSSGSSGSSLPIGAEDSEVEPKITLQVDSDEEFEESLTTAQKFFDLEVSQDVKKGSLATIILLIGIVAIIIIFLAYSFLRKPKNFANLKR